VANFDYMANNLTVNTVEPEVRRLLTLILHRPAGETEEILRAAEPAWDSLKHVEIVFLMEDHFGIRFTEPDLNGIESASDIARIVKSKLARAKACSTVS